MIQKHLQLSTAEPDKKQDASHSCFESTIHNDCGTDQSNDDFVNRYSCAALCWGLNEFQQCKKAMQGFVFAI